MQNLSGPLTYQFVGHYKPVSVEVRYQYILLEYMYITPTVLHLEEKLLRVLALPPVQRCGPY